MPQSALERTKDLVLARMQSVRLSTQQVQEAIRQAHTRVTSSVPLTAAPPSAWRKSILQETIRCLECGESLKQLTIRHLRQHGLTARSYRVKYGMPRHLPLAARELLARRRQVVRDARPWEKSPTFLKAQGRAGKASSEPEAGAPIEAAQARTPASPTRPRRQRKSARKITARKKAVQA